jgi:hypothetical protein
MYICPMHPEVTSKKPGKCPKCGMDLVKLPVKEGESMEHSSIDHGLDNNYNPLIVIISLIILVALTLELKSGFSALSFISNFMIGFFITFAGFKLINLKGFKEGYSTYDLLARRLPIYAYVYPFIELFFGLAMLYGNFSRELLFAEVLVMGFSGLGVAIKIAKREKFQCVCLGTVLKVPLTKVTLIEDFGMAALALLLLLI